MIHRFLRLANSIAIVITGGFIKIIAGAAGLKGDAPTAGEMRMIGLFGRVARRMAAVGAAGAVVAGLAAAPQPAHALGTGAAVGIGLGAFALGTALASPYYYGYPGYYGYPAYYYPPAPAPYYPYPPRNCWNPYYQRYYPC
jgi:hypothetical protein